MLVPIPELGYFKNTLLPGQPRSLYWVGSSKQDLMALPQPVVRTMGIALGVAQWGGKHPAAKHRKGLGAAVLEIEAVYAVSFENAVYVLGVKSARTDVELIRQRLKIARADYEARYGQDSK